VNRRLVLYPRRNTEAGGFVASKSFTSGRNRVRMLSSVS